MSVTPFELSLPTHQWVNLTQSHFYEATDGAKVPQQTLVRLKQDGESLFVEFECKNDPYWNQTTPTEHNSNLWNQEVFEVFIAEGADTPNRYLEIEINPNNALFVGWVDNPSGEGDANTLTMVPYHEAGIAHRITGTTPDSWRGEIRLPLSLVGNQSGTYRINFYRIVLLKPQTNPEWTCSTQNSSFQCWSPTLSGTTPRFHRPASFGLLRFP